MTGLQEDPVAASMADDEPDLLPKDDLVVDTEEEDPENFENDEEDEEEEENEDESDDEEEEDATDPGHNDVDMDDDHALLAMAKRRLAEQQAKQEILDQQARAAAAEAEEDDDDDDHYSEEEDGDDQVKPATNDDDGAEEETTSDDDDEDEQQEENTGNDQKGVDGKQTLSVTIPEPTDDTEGASPTRRERDENAELWALLRESQTRVAETKDMVVVADDDDSDSEDEDGATPEPSSAVESEAVTDDVVDSTADGMTEEENLEESKRNFEKENQELWELLAKSKCRLEEAALQKMREAEKAAAADEDLPPRRKSVVDENPYKDIDVLPDEATSGESEEALTQKELLLAMAVAEEAARSGKEIFETPSKEELRTRDIESFEFLKTDQPTNLPEIPEAPIGNDAMEEERERNRFATLSQSLSTRWTAFRQRVNEIDHALR
eukprot:CAMPEP_0119012050 /NCGR_PEP_ID=MMETSP1176-20130426/6047_1 /TAXON_ID=265551 /ORGANISM="Synedropsis recta cf, Strain CCMP1620" /LENGTH=437 /DNA_ID=CAMNT_0006964951 /DNA_START=71 /DNA_END=1384 /DNA_ORIENTATION=-